MPNPVYIKNMEYNYTFTSAEDVVLTEMIGMIFDLGLPEHIDQEAFDSVADKILHTYLRPPTPEFKS